MKDVNELRVFYLFVLFDHYCKFVVYDTGFGSAKKNDLLVCILRVWRITN